MQIPSRFTIAVHMLVCMETFKDERKITSDFLASSINVNPVIIRTLLSKLKAAEIIDVKRGTGGTSILKPLEEITLLEVCNAVDCIDKRSLFHFHENPSKDCPVGKNIHGAMDDKLSRAQKALEAELQSITLAEVQADLNKLMAE